MSVIWKLKAKLGKWVIQPTSREGRNNPIVDVGVYKSMQERWALTCANHIDDHKLLHSQLITFPPPSPPRPLEILDIR